MRALILGGLVAWALPGAAQEADPASAAPLSAIDWLSESVAPASSSSAASPAPPGLPRGAAAPGVTVTPLARPEDGPVGILPAAVSGLPEDLWRASDGARLAALVRAEPHESLPALQELASTLMLAVAAPPADASARDFLLLRVDKLLAMGALEAARSLLEAGDLLDPELFRRWFDVTLLTGTEHDACAILRSQPSLAPTLPARVFCLARNGDWPAAALTLGTARALGDVSAEDDALLNAFLDPDFAEPGTGPSPASRPSPLAYRLREAVGDIMPTTGLPLAFAHADLRDTVAWRAQIEAAERLARHGALSENALLGAYTARRPAASGGVWDRAAAIQRLDAAVAAQDDAALAAALPPAWAAAREAGVEVAVARLYGAAVAGRGLPGEAGRVAATLGLLSPAYRDAARAIGSGPRDLLLWRAVALGETEGIVAPDARSQAVVAGLSDPELAPDLAAAVEEGRLGEALLVAAERIEQGLDGDLGGVTQGLALLRAVGLDDRARQAALQFLILGDAA